MAGPSGWERGEYAAVVGSWEWSPEYWRPAIFGLAVLGAGLVLSFCVPVVLCVQEARQDKNRARFLDTRIAQFVDVPLPNDPDNDATAEPIPPN